ncbi:MAG: DNA polymerase I [Clostridia bacterium]|nr:DNA polymerase I [Clostridia bacterium]MDD4376054.1 DNA polymerase I [Clostridia bacterium]
MEKQKFLVVDGNSIMNRAFYGIKLLATKDGLFTNAIYGFLNILYMVQDKLDLDYIAVAFDLRAPTFRHEMFDEYKAHRKMMPDELRVQMPIIKEILTAMNIPIYEVAGFEADDILGTISKVNDEKDIETYILTGDKDSFQLISNNTTIIMPTTKKGKTEYTFYTPELLKEKYNIDPIQVIDVKALMGDSSDNIPGIPGIGEKTAYSLITANNSIRQVYDNIDNINCTESVRKKLIDNKDVAFLSYDLAKIDTNVDIRMDLDNIKIKEPNLPELKGLFERLSFKKFLDRYEETGDIVSADNTKFYNNFEEMKFINIEEEYDTFSLLIESNKEMYVVYINNTKTTLDNVFAILCNNTICYMMINENNKEKTAKFLNMVCINKINKIGYDLKAIYNLSSQYNIDTFVNFTSDVKLAYYLLNSSENNYTMENILYTTLKVTMPIDTGEEKETKKASQTSLFDTFTEEVNKEESSKKQLTENQKKYIYAYVFATKKLNNFLEERIKQQGLKFIYYDMELPLSITLNNIEKNGMLIDKEKLMSFGEELSKMLEKLEKEIYIDAGEEFNVNSPMQLSKILFEVLGIPTAKKNKTGYSTDKETLESLSNHHIIIDKILEYRKISKLKSTFVDGMLDCIEQDGRIHTTFMQTVTSTGRISSIEPNLQNIPVRTELGAKIRECFIAKPGNVIIDADYSQIELRLLAHMSNDETMINAFINGDDIHTITASQVFNIPLDEVTSELRSKAKAVNFGIVYGISGFGLAKNINSSRAEASEYIKNYLEKYHSVKEFMEKCIKDGTEHGFVKTLFGRIRTTEELKASNKNTIMFGERIAMNAPIQGTAADIIKLAMNKLYNEIKKQKLNAKIIMQVHDELLIEAPESEKDKVIEIMKNSMQNIIDLKVPLEVSINIRKILE